MAFTFLIKRFFFAILICFLGSYSIWAEEKASLKTYSDLWGKQGEKWKATGRIPDFSFAGYHSGEKRLPRLKKTKDMKKDFGAVGDGKTDDTLAFKNALKAGAGQVIYIPEGKYKITDILRIRNSHCVLRGAGPKKTILYFPKNLTEIKPSWGKNSSGTPTSHYSWSQGFIRAVGSYGGKRLTSIAKEAKRGSRQLEVKNGSKIKKGDTLQIILKDTAENSLAKYLYQNQPGDINKLKGRTRYHFICKVRRIKKNKITIDRVLPVDMKLKWKPFVMSFKPKLTEIGIEDFCIEFPNGTYKGHFTELGYNGFCFQSVVNCWARNIKIVNSESGFFSSTYFCTFKDIVIESKRKPDKRGRVGHHAISISGHDNLLTGFNIKVKYIHDITVLRSRNVVANGKGVDLCFDHHRHSPNANLFTNIDIGLGTRMYLSGGGRGGGKHAGAWITFWNIKSKKPIRWPSEKFAPDHISIVGISSDQPSIKDKNGKWFEVSNGNNLFPQNLYEAQLKKRLKNKN